MVIVMNEIWKPIIGYEKSYEVSNLGNVRSIDRYCIQKNNRSEKYNHIYRGKILKQYKNNAGYMQVQLSYQYKSIPKRVHRLVAETFLNNPHNYKCVNHINGDKTDNRVENLEWCSQSYNMKEAFKNGLKKPHKGMTYKKRCELAIEYIECALSEDKETPTKYEDWRLDLLEILNGK